MSRLFTTTIFNRFFYLSFYKGTTYGMISLNDVTFAKSPLHRFSRSTAFNELVANVFQPCRERSTCSQPSPPLVVFRCLCARIFYFSLYVLKRIEKRASLSVLSTRSRSKGKTARRWIEILNGKEKGELGSISILSPPLLNYWLHDDSSFTTRHQRHCTIRYFYISSDSNIVSSCTFKKKNIYIYINCVQTIYKNIKSRSNRTFESYILKS